MTKVFPLWSNINVNERPALISGDQVSDDAGMFILHTLKQTTQGLQLISRHEVCNKHISLGVRLKIVWY